MGMQERLLLALTGRIRFGTIDPPSSASNRGRLMLTGKCKKTKNPTTKTNHRVTPGIEADPVTVQTSLSTWGRKQQAVGHR